MSRQMNLTFYLSLSTICLGKQKQQKDKKMNELLKNCFINTLTSKLTHKPTEQELRLVLTNGIEYYLGDCSNAKLVDLENALDDYIADKYIETAYYGNKILAENALEFGDKYFESETELDDYCQFNGYLYDSELGCFIKGE